MADSINTLKKVIDIFRTSDDIVITKQESSAIKEKLVVKELENMNVGDLMEKRFIILSPSATIKDAAKVFIEKDMIEAVIVEGGKFVGIITHRDILRIIEEINLLHQKSFNDGDFHKKMHSAGDFPISKIIKKKVYVFPNTGLFDAIIKMDESDLTVLPVVDEGGYIVGILKERDIIQSFLAFLSR